MLDFGERDVDKRRPMALQVKICGITGVEAADAALKAGADFAGLVFYPKSPRHVVAEKAAILAAHLRGRLRIVALLADASDDEAAAAVVAAKPDFLQLHGQESPARVAAVRARFGLPVIKAIAIADAQDFASVFAYEDVADMLLFDAKSSPSSTRPGGRGAAFDWQLLRGRTFARPWLLAGGLAADNVARAIRATGAAGVDVSSGVESAPGVKDPDAIRAFVAAARAAQFARESET